MSKIDLMTEAPFEISEIEDVRILLKVKGKHYSIISDNKEEGKLYRISLVQALLTMEGQRIITPALEDVSISTEF